MLFIHTTLFEQCHRIAFCCVLLLFLVKRVDVHKTSVFVSSPWALAFCQRARMPAFSLRNTMPRVANYRLFFFLSLSSFSEQFAIYVKREGALIRKGGEKKEYDMLCQVDIERVYSRAHDIAEKENIMKWLSHFC